MIYTLVVRNEQGVIETNLTFDSVASYSENWSGTVSKSTVESGFPIADHINIENPVFNISGVLSAYSIFSDNREVYWNGEDFVASSEQSSVDQHIEAKKSLIKVVSSGTVVTLLESKTNSFLSDKNQKYEKILSGKVNEYNNCVITDLSFEVSENTQNSAIKVSMKIEQLNIARTQTTELTEQEMQKSIIPKVAKVSTNAGTSAASTTTDATTKPKNVAEKESDVSAVKSEMNIPPEARKQIRANEAAERAYQTTKGLLGYAENEEKDFEWKEINGGVVISLKGEK